MKNVYKHITAQLSKENHKFQVTRLGHGARMRDYFGIEECLRDTGIINIAYNVNSLTLPLQGNEIFDNFKMYYQDHALYFASLDEEAKQDIVVNGNYEIYNGAFYESLVSESLVKSGYELYFYKSIDATIEIDFLIRVKNELIPIEVKKNRGRSKSMNAIIEDKQENIKYGVKLTNGNIGFSDNRFTFPYFSAFLLRRFF